MNLKLIGISLLALAATATNAQKPNLKHIFKDAAAQTNVMISNIPAARDGKAELVVPRTFEDGKLKLIPSKDWTSGFFPGQMWFLYEFTKDNYWKNKADSFTVLLDKEKFNAGTHDMGFKIFCSYGQGYRLTNSEAYKEVIIQSAKTLTKRFNKKIGSIKSWDFVRQNWQFPVIVDNMMNLELLFAATVYSGDSTYYNIAVTHANTTLKNHFRSNNSSYHLVDYDTVTGLPRGKQTVQGFADSSSWARGQAWGLYGYTVCYRFTKDKKYLEQADKIAQFIMNDSNLPEDAIPYWDYNATDKATQPRDASAAAITASALYELAGYSKQAKKYKAFASKILKSLTKSYRSPIGENKGFIVMHSTGHKPSKSEIDVPINYADYYYLEALLKSRKK